MRKWVIAVLAAFAVLGIFFYLAVIRTAPVLTFTTWAGSYGHAQASALVQAYGERGGVDVRIAEYDGGTAELKKQVAGGKYDWDVIDMELPDAVEACADGLLDPIDANLLPAGANGTPARADFIAGAIGPCWVGSVVYSQAIAYAPARFGAAAPQTLGDFFDLKRFPGPRALRRTSAKFNLELALLADGVAPKDVYAELSTPQGLARALAKLDTLKGHIAWWTRSSEPLAMLADGRAAFATVLDGDLYDVAVHQRAVGTIWDRQLYELDVFAVPKGNPRHAMAMDFIRFATSAEREAAVADWVPYGPSRRSALALVRTNPELGIAMTPFLPTAPGNFVTAFAIDDEWWHSRGDAVEERWQAWLAGR